MRRASAQAFIWIGSLFLLTVEGGCFPVWAEPSPSILPPVPNAVPAMVGPANPMPLSTSPRMPTLINTALYPPAYAVPVNPAFSGPAPGRPVSASSGPVSTQPSLPAGVNVQSYLTGVTGIMVQNHGVWIQTPPGAPPIRIKSQFTLSNPSRLVLDLENTLLQVPAGPLPNGMIAGLPVQTIRLSQFDANTVRVVVETDDPTVWQLQPVVGNGNLPLGIRLAVNAPPAPPHQSLAGRFRNWVFGPPTSSISSTTQPQARPLAPNSAMTGTVRPGFPSTPYLGAPISPTRRRIVDAARSQLGITKAEQREYVNQVYSLGRDEPWCADFVSTVLSWSGQCPWGHTALVKDIYTWGASNQRLRPYPVPGDVVVFSFSPGSFDHTAIVENVNPDGTFTTIGGNEGSSRGVAPPGGMVQRNHYPLQDKQILGFVDPVMDETQTAMIPGR